MILLLAVALFIVGTNARDCRKVDCSRYSFKVKPHSAGYQECRLKILKGIWNKVEDIDTTGLVVHGYADKSAYKPSQDCVPNWIEFPLTESPSLGQPPLSDYPGDKDYRECCVPKVLNFCYYKVTIRMFCAYKWDSVNYRSNDWIQWVNIIYRNIAKNKQVNVVYWYIGGRLLCWSSMKPGDRMENGKRLYRGKRVTRSHQCGDSDLNVTIGRYTDHKNKRIVLVAKRAECNNQYVKIYEDPEKYTMRTIVDHNAAADKLKSVDGAQIAPVLAHTFAGQCGKIAKSVTVTKDD